MPGKWTGLGGAEKGNNGIVDMEMWLGRRDWQGVSLVGLSCGSVKGLQADFNLWGEN